MTKINVTLYATSLGTCPFSNWFDGLENQASLKVRTAIARMEAGNPGDVKSIGGGVLERRIHYGPGFRLYFGQDGTTQVILLVGGSKKHQSNDIEHAKRLWADYNQRQHQGEE